MSKGLKVFLKILKWIGIVIGACALAGVLLVLCLTLFEYKPKGTDPLVIDGETTVRPIEGNDITVMSWNIGYGALGDNADFFMDGGTHVSTSTKARINENLNTIAETVKKINPDITIFQEVDLKSKRSHYVDEKKSLMSKLPDYEYAFAYNYKVGYIPYPFPTIGKVACGLLTSTAFDSTKAERVALPCPFTWPVRIVNLKRCLLVNRIPVAGSSKELVIVNLHLEAYDSGEGKIAQTKMLREILENEVKAGNYVIAGGDFNQCFSNVDTSMYPLTREDLWVPGVIDTTEFQSLSFIQDNSVPSCRSLDRPFIGDNPETFQYYMIDGFIVSSNITVKSIETVDAAFKASDHNPVVLKASLN